MPSIISPYGPLSVNDINARINMGVTNMAKLYPPWWESVVTEGEAMSKWEQVGIAKHAIPSFIKTEGPFEVKEGSTKEVLVQVNAFKSAISIHRDDMIFNKRKELFSQAINLPVKWPIRKRREIVSLIRAGASTTLAFDGSALYSSRAWGGTTLDNDITADISAYPVAVHGTTTMPSVDEAQYVMSEIVNTFAGFTDAEGDPIDASVTGVDLVMSPSLKPIFASALTNRNQANTVANLSNLAVGGDDVQIRVYGDMLLAADTAIIYAFARGPGLPPPTFLLNAFLGRKVAGNVGGEELEIRVWDESSDFYKDNSKYKWGAEGQFAVGCGHFISTLRCTMV